MKVQCIKFLELVEGFQSFFTHLLDLYETALINCLSVLTTSVWIYSIALARLAVRQVQIDLTKYSLRTKVFGFKLEFFFSEVVVEVLLYVHRNRRFIRDGSPGRLELGPAARRDSATETLVVCSGLHIRGFRLGLGMGAPSSDLSPQNAQK